MQRGVSPLCNYVQESRGVANGNTVRYGIRIFQITEHKHRYHYVGAQVRVHEFGSVQFCFGTG